MTLYLEIEAEVARRCGPYLDDVVADSGAAWAYPTGGPSLSAVVLPTLQSSLELGDTWTGRYLLRRGLLQDASGTVTVMPTGVPTGGVAPFFQTGPLAADRIRRIASVDFTTGTVAVDRPWTNFPASNELIELHYLDPDRELKLAVTKGLERCYVENRSTLTTTGQATERDVTALAPWITQTDQITNAQWNYPTSFQSPVDIAWVNPFYKDGHVWLGLSPDPFPNQILLTARRSIATLVSRDPINVNIITATTPLTCTAVGHGLLTGEMVTLTSTITALVGTWAVVVVDADTFTLTGTTAAMLPIGPQQTFATLAYSLPPYQDVDTVPTTLAYAAAAGHIEAWRRFPGRLIGGAQVGLFPSQKEAASEFSQQTDANYRPSAGRVGFDSPFPVSAGVQRV